RTHKLLSSGVIQVKRENCHAAAVPGGNAGYTAAKISVPYGSLVPHGDVAAGHGILPRARHLPSAIVC
ncbi:unnamed protein product, partial [Pylaiella littoralis]